MCALDDAGRSGGVWQCGFGKWLISWTYTTFHANFPKVLIFSSVDFLENQQSGKSGGSGLRQRNATNVLVVLR